MVELMRRRGTGAGLVIALVLTLASAGSASADGEYEPNDSITQTAGPLVAGVSYTATQDTDNDVDWYRFYTGGQVQLTVTGTLVLADSSFSGCNIELRDRKGRNLNEVTIYEGEFSDMKQTLYRPGIYYLQVECGYTGDRYRFSLTPASATVSEACGLSLDQRVEAARDLSDARERVARAKARKQRAHGRRAKQRAKAKLRRARGVARNAQTVLSGWDAAVAANC